MQPSGHGHRGAPAEGSHNTLFLSLKTVKKEDCVKAVGHRFREPARRNHQGDAMFITSHQEKRHVMTSPKNEVNGVSVGKHRNTVQAWTLLKSNTTAGIRFSP